jgi:hypothetical protein
MRPPIPRLHRLLPQFGKDDREAFPPLSNTGSPPPIHTRDSSVLQLFIIGGLSLEITEIPMAMDTPHDGSPPSPFVLARLLTIMPTCRAILY